MVALRRDAVALALFHGTPAPGTLFEISIGVTPKEADAIRARLGAEATVLESTPEWLRFEDPFGFRWAVQPHDAVFRSSGSPDAGSFDAPAQTTYSSAIARASSRTARPSSTSARVIVSGGTTMITFQCVIR